MLSTRHGSTDGGNGPGYYVVISSNGVAAFQSAASDLVALDSNFSDDVFARAPGDSAPKLLSFGVGVTGDNLSSSPRVSASGNAVAFMSNAGNLVDRKSVV